MSARLVVSLSGLPADTPWSADLARAEDLAAALDARGVHLTHLLRPRGDDGPARRGAPVVEWLHDRRALGDAIALHGYDHTPDPIGSWGAVPRLARRAEFATLPRHEAALRLTAARRAAAGVGLTTDLFVPPRWLASPGTLDALRDQGFTLCADETSVRLLPGGTQVRARLLGFRGDRAVDARDARKATFTASGAMKVAFRAPRLEEIAAEQRAAEAWRCRLLPAEVARTARRGGLVRIALRAKDLRRPARVAAALAAVDAALAVGAVPVTYRAAEAVRAA